MIVNCLQTKGLGYFEEVSYEVPNFNRDQIQVLAVMTGVCRSDIDMMTGSFGPLPLHMQGHEGIGQVIGIGDDCSDVRIGDYVATRGEPAYADRYLVNKNEYVKIPEAHPRYILEPVACGINLIYGSTEQLQLRQGTNDNNRILIVGSGFLAWVAYHTLRLNGFVYHVDVLGTSNKELWGDKLQSSTNQFYDVVIDLTGKHRLGVDIQLTNNSLIIDGVGKSIDKEEAQIQLWKSCSTVRPSPRNNKFINCMHIAKYWIEKGYLEVDNFWSQCYSRSTEWKQAFTDGLNRPKGYNRGYIKWD
jgi:D-arabinose 1-dehydrogenase-like Zn-dependent alcohol dehydrogenase